MAFLTEEQIQKIGFKSYGKNLKISDKAVFYRPEHISIGSDVRIDDFCVLANNIIIHNNVHIALYTCLLSSENSVIEMHDFSGVAFRSLLLTNTDDYTGEFMTNPTIFEHLRKITEKSITVGRHGLIGTGSTVFPGANIAEGTSVGAMSLVTKPTLPWKVYFGVPARPIMNRSKHLLELEKQYMKEKNG